MDISQDKTEGVLFAMKWGLVRWFRFTDNETSPVGCLVGDAEPPDETPFHRKQNIFCFVLNETK